jgi:uncharacterized membrane protein (TIGR02234 family)
MSVRTKASSGTSGLAGRRGLAYAIVLCLAGAALALYASTRTWTVEVTARPAPLPDLRTAHDGPAWLAPIAVVGLAAAGAVLATRAAVRRAVGVLLVLIGGGIAAGGAHGLLAGGSRGQVLTDSRLWPALCLVGGLAVVAAGGLTAARGQTWPAMGARYERGRDGTSDRPVPAARNGSVASTQAWDALDRGEDPTLR